MKVTTLKGQEDTAKMLIERRNEIDRTRLDIQCDLNYLTESITALKDDESYLIEEIPKLTNTRENLEQFVNTSEESDVPDRIGKELGQVRKVADEVDREIQTYKSGLKEARKAFEKFKDS
jgi:chromosome segregation ATPase